MDDLNSVISSILGDPQKMDQLRNVAQSLGMNPGAAPAPAPAPAPAQPQPDMMNMLGNLMNGMNQNASQPPPAAPSTDQASAAPGGLNMGALSALAGVFGGMNNAANDKNVQLLRALQPHISSGRAGRIDDAVRIMQLISAWPALRDSGILGNLGNLGGLGNLFSGGGHR